MNGLASGTVSAKASGQASGQVSGQVSDKAEPDLLLDYSCDTAAIREEMLEEPVDDTPDQRPDQRPDQWPDEQFARQWVQTALAAPESAEAVMTIAGGSRDALDHCSVSVHLADAATSQNLNRDLRGADRATNVLSFPAGLPVLDGTLTLGELVLCPNVVQQEAVEQNKSAPDHWAHLLVHGTLHLLGFDHVEQADADLMEALETRLLSQSGISDPYEGTVRELDE